MSIGPQRIVCLTEEPTETLYALGEQERIGAVAQAAARAFALRRELDELERETVESAYATVFGETR